jgi:molybdate transport system substrate-binding protein
MKIRSVIAAANIGFMFLFVVSIAAEAAELRVLSGRGMQVVMKDLGPRFEHATGNTLVITYATATEDPIIKSVQDGEAVDVVISSQETIAKLVKNGKAAMGNVTVIARSGIGVAIRKGTPKPDISSPEALKRTLLAAKSITYPSEGVTEAHFAKVLTRLGIASEMKSKTVFSKNQGAGQVVGRLVANGEAEIGVGQSQGLILFDGIEYVGPLPGDLQLNNVLSAAIMTSATNKELSKALIDFLRTPEAAAVFKAKGMEPATP